MASYRKSGSYDEENRMLGYHYTSKELYQSIKKEGLTPYGVRREELAFVMPEGLRGIWVWEHELAGYSEAGTIIYQISSKKSPYIVKLLVEFDEKDRISRGSLPLEIPHEGNIGDWEYHKDALAWIIGKAIPSDKIKLIKEYDLLDLIKE